MSNMKKRKLKFYPSSKQKNKQFHIYTTYTDIFKQKHTHSNSAKKTNKKKEQEAEQQAMKILKVFRAAKKTGSVKRKASVAYLKARREKLVQL